MRCGGRGGQKCDEERWEARGGKTLGEFAAVHARKTEVWILSNIFNTLKMAYFYMSGIPKDIFATVFKFIFHTV